MAAPTLQDYQFWFGLPNEIGKLFGFNTNVEVTSVEGIEALNIRSGTRELPRSDGAVPGLHTVSMKTPIFNCDILGDAEYYDFISVITTDADEEGELHFKFPGVQQAFMRARLLSRTDKRDGFTTGAIPITVAFECANPRIYGIDMHSQGFSIWDAATEGLDWNIDWGVDFTVSGGGGGDVVVHNAGNAFAYPIIRIFGPLSGTCTGLTIANLTTGKSFETTTDLLINQILTIDMDARIRGSGSRIIDLDGASRYGDWVLPRDTLYLQPGDNVIRLTITGTSTAVSGVINWRDTSYEGVI